MARQPKKRLQLLALLSTRTEGPRAARISGMALRLQVTGTVPSGHASECLETARNFATYRRRCLWVGGSTQHALFQSVEDVETQRQVERSRLAARGSSVDGGLGFENEQTVHTGRCAPDSRRRLRAPATNGHWLHGKCYCFADGTALSCYAAVRFRNRARRQTHDATGADNSGPCEHRTSGSRNVQSSPRADATRDSDPA